MEEVVAGPFRDREQGLHGGDLLDLLLQEPQHELLAEGVALVAGGAEQRLDLGGHLLLLHQCQLDRLLHGGELVDDRVDAGDAHAHVPVEQVLHEHHRVVPFLDRLAVEVGSQLRQVQVVEPHGDRHVLLAGRELVADLFLQEGHER